MNRQCQYCSVFIVLILWDKNMFLKGNTCDNEEYEDLPEGNIGESGYFPWLGVLKVYLYQNADERIAMTGIVLVKEKFALANTDDIVRIPRKTFLRDTKAMFIPTPGQTWTAKVKDYLAHPEYPRTTINTIAVLELDVTDPAFVPMKPICWPHHYFNADNHFYAIGFQDDTDFLEKYLYRMTYLKRSDCEIFYNQSRLTNVKMIPAHFQCGHSEGHAESCVWDTGMVMASNASGQNWILVGFGIRGPGCSLPSRFIDIFPYIKWIDSATAVGEVEDLENRESAFNTGFGNKKHQTFEEVPIHETFLKQPDLNDYLRTGNKKPLSLNETRRGKTLSYDPYQMKYDTMKAFIVNRIDDGAIHIQRFDEQYEQYHGACNAQKVLIYRDKMRLVDESGNQQTIAYRISLYDMVLNEYTCIQVKVKSLTNQESLLWYTTYIDDNEGISFGADETPKNLLKRYREHKMKAPKSKPRTDKWIPGPHMEAPRDIELLGEIHKWNINLLIRLSFVKEAQMNISVFGPLKPALKEVPVMETKKAARKGEIAPQNHFQHDEAISTFFKTGITQTTEPPVTQSVNQIQPSIIYSYPFNQGAQYPEKEGDRLKFIYPGREFQQLKSSVPMKNKILVTNTSHYEPNDNPKNKYQNFYIIENNETAANELRKLSIDTLEVPMSLPQSTNINKKTPSVGAYSRNYDVITHSKHNLSISHKNISHFNEIPLNRHTTKAKTEKSYIKKKYPKFRPLKAHFKEPISLKFSNTPINKSKYSTNLFVSDIPTINYQFSKGEKQMPILKADTPNIKEVTFKMPLLSEKSILSKILKNIPNTYNKKTVPDTTIPIILSDHKRVNKSKTEIKKESPIEKIWINPLKLPPIIHKKVKNTHSNQTKHLSLLVLPLSYNSNISALNKSDPKIKKEYPVDKIWTKTPYLPPIIHKKVKNSHKNKTKPLSLLVLPLSYNSNISLLNKSESEFKKKSHADKIWINSPKLPPIIHKKIKNTHKNTTKHLSPLVLPLSYNLNISSLNKSETEFKKESHTDKIWIKSPKLLPIIHKKIKNTHKNTTKHSSLLVLPLFYNSSISMPTTNYTIEKTKNVLTYNKSAAVNNTISTSTSKTHFLKGLMNVSLTLAPTTAKTPKIEITLKERTENKPWNVRVKMPKQTGRSKIQKVFKNIAKESSTQVSSQTEISAHTSKVSKVMNFKSKRPNDDMWVKTTPKPTRISSFYQNISNRKTKDKPNESSTLISTQTEISILTNKVPKVKKIKSKHPTDDIWVTRAPKPKVTRISSLNLTKSYNLAKKQSKESSTLISTQTEFSVRTRKVSKITNFKRKHSKGDTWVTRTPKPNLTTSFNRITENVRNKRILEKNKYLDVSTTSPWDIISTLDKPLQEYMKSEDPKDNSESTKYSTLTSHEHDQKPNISPNYAVETTIEPDDDVLSILGILTA